MSYSVLCLTALVETSPQALPLGAACISSAIKNSLLTGNDFKSYLYDFSLEDLNFPSDAESAEKKSCTDADCKLKKIAEDIKNKFPELNALCFSVYVWNRNVLEKLSLILKDFYPDILTVAGGPEVTANPFNFEHFDFLVCGAGEVSVPELLENVFIKKIPYSQIKIKGVYFFNEGAENNFQSLTEIARSENPSLENLSSPYLDGTVNLKKYGGALWELSRGCPFKCSYCYESKGEKIVKHFPLERIKKELIAFEKSGISQVFVLDPTYNANKKYAVEILDLIKKHSPDLFFYFEARAEFIDMELAEKFSELNCALQFGLQSSSEEVLKNVNRTFNKKIFSKNINYLNQTGVTFGFDLIYGLPGDTLAGYKESLDFALKHYPNNLELFCLSVLPGTELGERAESLGLTWQKNPPYNVIESKTFSSKDIGEAAVFSAAVDSFYNKGRAVPWFNSLLYLLKIKASVFLDKYKNYLASKNLISKCSSFSFEQTKSLQKEFIQTLLSEKKIMQYNSLVQELIEFHGALSECTATGKSSTVTLHYHPDDLMSSYSQDIDFFYKNAGRFLNKTKVFCSENGTDWKVLK